MAKFKNMTELNEWNQKILKETKLIQRTNTSLVWHAPIESTSPNEID